MKSKLFSVFLIALAVFTTPAFAREPVPVINHVDIPVLTAGSSPVSAENVKQAIITAGSIKGWTITQQPDGKMAATLNVRGKHTVVIDIAYTTEKYSLTYKDSSNMKFEQRDGQLLIHPFYNKWVQALKDAIRIELLKI